MSAIHPRIVFVLMVATTLAACRENASPPPGSGHHDMASPPAAGDMATARDRDGGGDEPGADGGGRSDGPVILSLTTNVSDITQGESIRIVAVVAEPSGLQNLVGGTLTTPDGSKAYSGFVAANQGTYNLDLSWS